MRGEGKYKILIADDHPLIHKLYSDELMSKGYEVLNAYDGLEAIMYCMEHKPNLIILDISMPKADGRDICKTLKDLLEIFNENEIVKIKLVTYKL